MLMEQEEAASFLFFFFVAHGWIQKQLEEKTQVCWVFHVFILDSIAPEQCTAPFQCSKRKSQDF